MADPYVTQPVPCPPPVYPMPVMVPYPPMMPAPAPLFIPQDAGRDPRRRQSARDVNRMSLLCFAQLALSAGWGFLFGIVFVLGGIDLFKEEGLAQSVFTGAGVVLSTGLVGFLFFAAGRHKTVDYLKFEKVGFFPGLLCVLAGAALILLMNAPASWVREALERLGYDQSVTVGEENIGGGGWLNFAFDFLGIALLAPMLEEILDRGIILTTLRKYGLGFSAVVSGLLFGLCHLDLSTMVFAIPAGLILGFIYSRTNNLGITIWIHLLNNAFAVLSDYGELLCPKDPELVGTALSLGLLGLGAVSLLLLLIFKRKVFMTRRSPRYDGPMDPFGAGQSLSAMGRAPMLWSLLGVVIAFTVLALV